MSESALIETCLKSVSKYNPEMPLGVAIGIDGKLANPAMATFIIPKAPAESVLPDPTYGMISKAIRNSPGWIELDDGMYDENPILVLNEETIRSAIESLRQGDKSWGRHLVRLDKCENHNGYYTLSGSSRRSQRRSQIEDEIWELTGKSPRDYIVQRKKETGNDKFILSNRQILSEIKGC